MKVTGEGGLMNSVWPSGAARNACVAPIDMPAPLMFSTMTGLPHFWLS